MTQCRNGLGLLAPQARSDVGSKAPWIIEDKTAQEFSTPPGSKL